VDVNREDRALAADELRERAQGCQALVCTLEDRIDRGLLEALTPPLRVVATFAVGHENIDTAAARELAVRVTHTPGVLSDATAELAVALLLACARRVVEGDQRTRTGRFRGFSPTSFLGRSVYGKTVGVVGAGRIGWRFARTLRRGFDCEILVHSRTPREAWRRELDARFVPLASLLEASDFVSLHCPLTPQTRHLIDADALARMKPSAVLINTARGPVVEEDALVDALRSGAIAAAGLDVYESEPLLAEGLADLPNGVLLPHVGSATRETREAMGSLCAEAVIAVLSGREPEHALV
jgi:glyoxylate reductase